MADQEGTITMSEVLERELALEEEAEAKLQENWGDENACTYDQGYITQPLYACGTCSAQGKSEVFGFCFGCSMNCHVDHDVYELFDKRHFKCDCGTPKSGCSCKFSEATRAQNNEENKYTHNFQAKYCWCDSTYDPDVDIMSQCIVCEDWFHHTCVARRTQIPDLSSFKGFLCHLCAAKHPLFLRYPQIQPNGQSTSTTDIPTNATSSTTTNQPTTATPSTTDQSTTATSSTTDKSTIDTNTTSTTNADNTNNNTTTKDTTKSESDTKENGKDTEKSTSEPQPCILDQHPAPPTPPTFPDIFLIPEWRKGICKCPSCATMYHTDHLEFLLDDADDPDVGGEEEGEGDGEAEGESAGTGEAEAGAGEGRKRKISMLESAEKAFLENPQIPHNNKLNLITGFSDMKTELKEYLRKFAESGRVVTEADIAEFFEELRKKRQRM